MLKAGTGHLWSEITDGTAIGPTTIIDTDQGLVAVQALWSDEEGVGVSVNVSPDAVWKKHHVAAVVAAVYELLDLIPPNLIPGVNA